MCLSDNWFKSHADILRIVIFIVIFHVNRTYSFSPSNIIHSPIHSNNNANIRKSCCISYLKFKCTFATDKATSNSISTRVPTPLWSQMIPDDYDEEDFRPTEFRIFMTQRSIQSFLFLQFSLRDLQTVEWIDRFLQPSLAIPDITETSQSEEENSSNDDNLGSEAVDAKNWINKKISSKLLYYHGISAFDESKVTSWDSVFFELVYEPSTTLLIQSYNPAAPDYELDIEPSKLCSRILSVRDQISKEWIYDLEVIATMGDGIFSSYWEHVQKDDGIGFDRPDKLFLEINPDPESDFKVSALRRGSFDLLMRLCTQTSICRLLQREDGIVVDESDRDNLQKRMLNKAFLKEFYVERLYKCFKGNIGKYGRTDDFLEELMLLPPRMVVIDPTKEQDESNILFVDPLGIAEIVVRERERVATEWRQLIIDVVSKGSDQLELRQQMLNRMMGIGVERTDFE